MSPKGYSHRDRTGAAVAVGMLVLALLGVATVFHQPIAAMWLDDAPASTPATRPPTQP